MESRKAMNIFCHPRRSLVFESLENRLPLATAAFMVNLYHDDNGSPGAKITNDTVVAGDTFFVEITAQEFAKSFDGMAAVALDMAWDPQVLREVDESWDLKDVGNSIITSNYPLYRRGTLDNSAGIIDNLTGYAMAAFNVGRTIGNGVPEQFSLLRFKALAPSNATTLTMGQGATGIVTVPVSSLRNEHLYFERQTITVLPRDATPQTPVEPVAPVATAISDNVALDTTQSGALNFCPPWDTFSKNLARADTQSLLETHSENTTATAAEGEPNSIPTLNPYSPTPFIPTAGFSWSSNSSFNEPLELQYPTAKSIQSHLLTAIKPDTSKGRSSTDRADLVDDLLDSDSFAMPQFHVSERLLDLLVPVPDRQ